MQLTKLQLIHVCMSDAPLPNVLYHVHLCQHPDLGMDYRTHPTCACAPAQPTMKDRPCNTPSFHP